MDVEKMINEISNQIADVLKAASGKLNGPVYSIARRQLGRLYLDTTDELNGIYQLTESHGVGLRQVSLLQMDRSKEDFISKKCISFASEYAKEECDGMIRRLKEMPSEWTIVQLTRVFNPMDIFQPRKAETSPKLKDFHIIRLPCGNEIETGCPIVQDSCWPDNAESDILEEFWNIKKKLGTKHGLSSYIRKLRNEASADTEVYCREIGPMALKEWLVLMLGKLCDVNLQNKIRTKIDKVLNKHTPISKRQRYIAYLLAEGCAHLNEDELANGLYQIFEENEIIQDDLFAAILKLKEQLSGLPVAKRHPVILIVDEHLDLLPWENLTTLRRHPMSRAPSLHFIHSLYTIHKNHIKNGLREIPEEEICYYIVNPGGDLPKVEEKLSIFLKKRFPSWIGIIGKKPSEQELIEALTNRNTFVYCGHGSGSQYLPNEAVLKLKVKPVQLLFGCSSVALKDHGGTVEMTGDVLQYAIAGSGCSVGMLWPVTSNDTDRLTMDLANIWLPGTPINPETLKEIPECSVKKEPELLRAMKDVRESVDLYTNRVALIARGIPIKIVPNEA